MRRFFLRIYILVLVSTLGVLVGSVLLVQTLPERNLEIEELLGPSLQQAAAAIDAGNDHAFADLKNAFGPVVAILPANLVPLDAETFTRLKRGEVIVRGNEVEGHVFVWLPHRQQVLELELPGIRNRIVQWTALARRTTNGVPHALDEVDALTQARLKHRPVAVASTRLGPAQRVLFMSDRGLRAIELKHDWLGTRRWYALGSLLVLCALSLLVPLRQLYKQLNALELGARELGRGKLDTRVPTFRAGSPVFTVARRFNEMAQQIADTLRTNEELLCSVAHEMRTPVARIVLALDLLEHDDPPTRRLRIEKMRRTLVEMQSLTDELLTFTRLGEPGRKLALARVDLCEILEDVVAEWEVPPLQAPKRPAWIVADAALIERACTNIVGNACRYATGAKVSLEATPTRLRVIVEDDGPGIPKDQRKRVFEPFVRLEHSRCRDTGGTGLGLSIVRRIVDAHRGTVTITDAPTGGTRVVLDIPRTPAQ